MKHLASWWKGGTKTNGCLHVFYGCFLWNHVWPAASVVPLNRISGMQRGFCIAAIRYYFGCEKCACRWVYAPNGHSRESVKWCECFPFFRCHFHPRCKCIGFHFDPVSCDKPNLQYHSWRCVRLGRARERERETEWDREGINTILKIKWAGDVQNHTNRYSHMWWQFEIVWSSVALNCVRRIVCNRFIRIDSNDKGTNVCLSNTFTQKKCINSWNKFYWLFKVQKTERNIQILN